MVEDGTKHTLVLYNCRVPQTGEVAFTAASAKCSANLKVKGELSRMYFPASAASCLLCLLSPDFHQRIRSPLTSPVNEAGR